MKTADRKCLAATLVFCVGALVNMSAQAENPIKTFPSRELFENKESFLKQVSGLFGTTIQSGAKLFVDGQQLFYDQGPGGKDPSPVIVDWAGRPGDIRLLQYEQNGKRQTITFLADPSRDDLITLVRKNSSAQLEDDFIEIFRIGRRKGVGYDPGGFWDVLSTNILPGIIMQKDMTITAYALYKACLGRSDFTGAEAVLQGILARCNWSRSLTEEWAELATMTSRQDLALRLKTLAGYLDTRTSKAVGETGTGLNALAQKVERLKIGVVIKPDHSQDTFDKDRVKSFMRDLSNYASKEVRGSILFDLVLFLSRKDPTDPELQNLEKELGEKYPELKNSLRSLRIVDLGPRITVEGASALTGRISTEITAFLKVQAE